MHCTRDTLVPFSHIVLYIFIDLPNFCHDQWRHTTYSGAAEFWKYRIWHGTKSAYIRCLNHWHCFHIKPFATKICFFLCELYNVVYIYRLYTSHTIVACSEIFDRTNVMPGRNNSTYHCCVVQWNCLLHMVSREAYYIVQHLQLKLPE